MQLGPKLRRNISVASLFLLVATLVVVASRAKGYDVPEPNLHDGGIWVTNESRRLIGRTNAEIATVDTKLSAGASSFDVLQSGDIVLIHQSDPPGLAAIDPAKAALVPGPELPADAQVGLGGETAALFDPDTGNLFVLAVKSSSAALGLDPASDLEPVYTIEGDGRLVVGVDGLVHLLDQGTGEITTWDADGSKVDSVDVPKGLDATLTAVGDRPVVLADSRLIVPGEDPVSINVGDDPTIQQPGPEAGSVLVAGSDRLVEVSWSGSINTLSEAGTGGPAQPVRLGTCSYGAWGADPAYVQACDGEEPVTENVGEMGSGDAMRFRVNRGRVTLNDITEGSQLLFGDGDPIFIDSDWAEALSDEIEIDPDAAIETDEQAEPTCESPKNGKPVAEPDEDTFGTRRDRPVVVYPLRNDKDPDCDVLLIDSVKLKDKNSGTVGIVDGGRAVQVDVASDVNRLRFDYTISDGRGGKSSSQVTVRVVGDKENKPPVLGQEKTTVVTGGTVTHNVLSTAYDPDGDVLRLLRAEENGTASGTVKANNHGDLTFTAGNSPGTVEISYVVGDGRGGEQTGVLTVDVVDRRENQKPIARNDVTSTFTGREVVFDVLDNDTDPNDDSLSIVRATAAENADVRWDPTSSEIRVAADKPGTINVVYRITDGQATDEAVLRVNIKDRGQKRPPVAVRDEVFVTGGEPAFVPVLDNDEDPDGEILVVLGVSDLPEPSPISVTILQRSVLKITAPTNLTEPVEFSYRISDGTQVADGRVLVEPAPTVQENRPPVVAADEYTVRAGGIVTFPVLTNDSDPDGDAIEVVEPPTDQKDVARNGRLFLSDGGLLRYEAPDKPIGSVRLIYSVRDTAENVASAEIVVHVLPASPDRNQPPIPPELVGRTIAGQKVSIPVPITTMDPDGDTVTLLGIDKAPKFGTVTEVRPDSLVYVPDENVAGTDEFTYKVVDQFGAEATATILVGIARPPSENNAPIAVDDSAGVRAGSTVSIPVLANDFDPDADPLTISPADDDRPQPALGKAAIDGAAIRYTAPAKPTSPTTSFRYTVEDGRGGRRSAVVTVTFRKESDNRPPVALDDASEPQRAGTPLDLPLTKNDSDPDRDALKIVEVTHPGAKISADGQRVTFEMPKEPVQFTYVISDGQATSRAAVSVPLIDPAADLPPIGRLDDDIEVDMGKKVTVDVLANDEDPEGKSVHLLRVIGVRHGSATIQGDKVEFSASEDRYVGYAGFSYVVGDSADPSVANTTVASARIKIIGDLNTPLKFTELTVDVPQAGERVIDLQGAVVDPDPNDKHTFEDLEVTGDGLDAKIDKTKLTISASDGAKPGTVGELTLVASDGTDEVTGTVRVNVTGSDKPLATVGPDQAQTFQGQAVDIDVLANDTNPFPETPLEITGVGQPTNGAGTVANNAGQLTFTPTDTFYGTTTFDYTVADRTGDPNRAVSGTVSVSVIGRPSAPPAPTCIGGESRSVRVQWSAPSANGAPITGYVLKVSGNGGGTGDRTLGNASTQDVDGLTNGSDYTFQVAAVNDAVTQGGGEPNFSPPSPTCTPDQVPGQPEAPTTTFGDRQLQVTWKAPPNEGSKIEKLILTNTTSGKSQEFGPTVTSYTWTGLENGTNVRFTLTAVNGLGAGPTSAPSTGDGTPAGVPAQPAPPNASPSVGARDGFLDVRWTWSSSQNNGDAVKRFRITSYKSGTKDSEVVISDPTARTHTFRTQNGVPYRFTVAAENKAGWSKPSGQSPEAVSAGKPLGTPTVSATEGDTATVLTVGGTIDANGAPVSHYEYDVNGNGNWQQLPAGGSVGGLTNGTTYTFRVRAVNSEGPGTVSAPSNAIRPYGVPTAPNVSRTVNGRTINWTWTASDGNGRAIDRYQYSVDGGGWRDTTGRSHSQTFGYSQQHTLRVRAVSNASDPNRKTSAAGSASGTTGAAPQPKATAYRTGQVPCESAPGDTCTQYNVRGSNFPANASGTATCQFSTNNGPWNPRPSRTISTNGNGDFTGESTCHVGVATRLRFEIQINGKTTYSNIVTK